MSGRPRNIAVIGAGPAGSVAAIALAKLGHRIALFEKARFPRGKVCGECLSATGIAVLERLGIARTIRELRPQRLRRTTAVATDGSSTTLALPAEMWGLTRRAMDAALLDVAAEHGVVIQTETAVELRRDAGVQSASLVTLGLKAQVGNLRYEVEADAVILADGRGSMISRAVPTGDFGIKAHFRDVDADRYTIELVALAEGLGYAGLAPVNDDLWNAAWSVPAALLKRHGGDVEALFRDAVDRSPHLQRRFARATRVGEWLTCPLPRHAVRRDWPRNVIPIGNAAAALEPVGGEGMGLAMRSAELAAAAIDRAARVGAEVDAAALRRQFDRLWRTRRAACRGAALALSHPLAGPLAVGLARTSPTLARAGLALVGK